MHSFYFLSQTRSCICVERIVCFRITILLLEVESVGKEKSCMDFSGYFHCKLFPFTGEFRGRASWLCMIKVVYIILCVISMGVWFAIVDLKY